MAESRGSGQAKDTAHKINTRLEAA